MKLVKPLIGLIATVIFLTSTCANAETVTYRFTGFMAEQGDPLLVGGSFGSIAPMTSFDGRFSYNTVQDDLRPENSLYGLYSFLDFSISISGQTAYGATENGWLAIANASTFDTLNILAGWSATEQPGTVSGTLGGMQLEQIRLDLTDTTNLWFLNDSLPSLITMDDFNMGKIGLHSSGMGGFREGRITSLEKVTVSPVPTPPAFLLMLTGLGLLGLSKRFRKEA